VWLSDAARWVPSDVRYCLHCVEGDVVTNPAEQKLQLKVDDVVWREVGDELVVL
jgi:hypothetical protein